MGNRKKIMMKTSEVMARIAEGLLAAAMEEEEE